ncbi:acyl-CoA dehydrogenase family member 9, mitochondrial-like [Rhopalosiphum maidis]|uniref:acyl-CoA dehydrogenase family member 9, mitochondrial-like n=1 Tax=Rhopalosiphum maidis TaxID=43146 RepID=UPI000F003B6A|nr:acyl-CoA dehydrogenase family member 9, mitochondrial-like [Rhopalosiphum maidis]
MSLYRFNISSLCRNYSQAAAAVSNKSHPYRDAVDQKLPSFAKSLYVGNFVKAVFARNTKQINLPKLDKLFSVCVPKEFGGLELSSALISEAYKQINFADFREYIAHGNVVKCINTAGTDEQKRQFLPQLASGESIASFCIYESKHGYDIQNNETKASQKNGKWVINGLKQWVVNGERADMFLVLAKTMDECNRPESEHNFFTAFLVKKSQNSGIKITAEGNYFNVTFNNVEADCILGSENEGLNYYTILFNGDLLESSSATLGEVKSIVQKASKHFHTHDRSSLIKLGKLNSHLYTMECVLEFTSLILDTYNPKSDYELILTRLFVNETTRSCLKLLNDLGLSKKSFKYIENSLLFEGRSNLLPVVGSLLGIQYAGQFMAEDVKQLRNPLMFPKYTLSHIMKIQRSLKDKPKLNHYIEKYLHPSLKKQAVDLEYCLSRFQFGVQNMFVNLGPDTCYYQMILERTNSIAMDLFALAAVLHRVSQKLSNSNTQPYPTELIFANVFCNSIREQCSQRVNEILNAPHNVVDPHYKIIGQNCFIEKNYFFEHPLKRNIF